MQWKSCSADEERKMATISVCMIVKNEEAVLARCLDSLQGLYEELIIVDTGSSDKTKEIAAGYTDKIYDFEWTGSFSDARNFSFSKASCEYIYAADADEVVDEENRLKFRMLKEALIPEVEIVQMYYENQLSQNSIYNYDKELRPKLYKRRREFIWQEPIHEAVRLDPIVFDSEVCITHLPQGEHGSRDLEVFEGMVEKGEDISPRLLDIYLRELYMTGETANLEKARPLLEKLCNELDPVSDLFRQAVTLLCREAICKGNNAGILKYALKGIMAGASSELCLELGDYFREQSDLQEAILWYHNAKEETESLMSLAASGEEPEKRMEECLKSLEITRKC